MNAGQRNTTGRGYGVSLTIPRQRAGGQKFKKLGRARYNRKGGINYKVNLKRGARGTEPPSTQPLKLCDIFLDHPSTNSA